MNITHHFEILNMGFTCRISLQIKRENESFPSICQIRVSGEEEVPAVLTLPVVHIPVLLKLLTHIDPLCGRTKIYYFNGG